MDADQITNLDAADADLAPGGAGDMGGTPEHAALPPIAWLQATEGDLVGLDFEAPIAGPTSATCDALSDLYRQAASHTRRESRRWILPRRASSPC
jgi:hypothetical protein